jgi:prevent-host-death family protein
MVVVGIKVLKNKLSEYVRLAAQGETVLVTDRGTVVAELSAPRAGRGTMVADAVLADLVRKGWLTPPALRSDEPPETLPVASLSEVLAGLDEDRAER